MATLAAASLAPSRRYSRKALARTSIAPSSSPHQRSAWPSPSSASPLGSSSTTSWNRRRAVSQSARANAAHASSRRDRPSDPSTASMMSDDGSRRLDGEAGALIAVDDLREADDGHDVVLADVTVVELAEKACELVRPSQL